MTDIATISVRLEIPAQKILAQAMEISESYKPIVSKALEEARHKLLFDEIFKTRVKELVSIELEKAIKSAIEQGVKQAVSEKYWDIEKEVIRIISKK